MEINREYPCNIANYRRGRRDRIKYIVIHYVGAEGSAKNNAKYYKENSVGCSAHYFVGHASEDGAVYESVSPENCAWHCGSETGKYYSPCRNDSAIGIELCCHKDKTGRWYFDDVTVDKAVELTRELMKKYNIDANHVIRHYDVTHKNCPAPFVENDVAWGVFKRRLGDDVEYTSVNDIVWELSHRGIVGDSDGMSKEMSANTDGRLYWLGRKIVQHIRAHEKSARNNLAEYENIHDIVWDLGYRKIISDCDGMEKEMQNCPNGRLYWLGRKGLHYIRLRD